MKTNTIGFTGKNARTFFGLLRDANVRTVLDVRLHNTSQLAGFAKKQDLPYLLQTILGADYAELPELAPEKTLLARYRSNALPFDDYADAYKELIARRRVESTLDISMFDHGCLLCSEHLPTHCHRRIAVEYLNSQWNKQLQITHLVA
jgi:uncharacterized protein (DUF488 family)